MHVSVWQMKQQAEQCAKRVQQRRDTKLPATDACQYVHNTDARQDETVKTETIHRAKALLQTPCKGPKAACTLEFQIMS